jgi:hypothetical protein
MRANWVKDFRGLSAFFALPYKFKIKTDVVSCARNEQRRLRQEDQGFKAS